MHILHHFSLILLSQNSEYVCWYAVAKTINPSDIQFDKHGLKDNHRNDLMIFGSYFYLCTALWERRGIFDDNKELLQSVEILHFQ